MKVEVMGGPFDGEVLEVDPLRAHMGIFMLDTTKMRMNARRYEEPTVRRTGDRLVTEPSKTPPPDMTPVPSVHMNIRNYNGKYYACWPKEGS